MGIRDLAATSRGRPVARALADLNARHPWSHNDHFHAWIVANLPARRGAALDVGCGRGALLEELAGWFPDVTGVDRDPRMRRAASTRCADLPGVRVEATAWEELEGPWDLVTMVAVLHHLDLAPALRTVRRHLAPGGRFLVVGLAPPVSPADHAWDLASMITNPLIGMVKHPWPRPAGVPGPWIPVAEPHVPLARIREVAQQELPGVRVQRHLGFRHTLSWQAPGGG